MSNRKPLNLYRRSTALAMTAALLSSLLLPSSGSAQSPAKKSKGPRAIAVVQWQTDGKGMAVPRLLPVTIRYEDKFYDASIYKASPIPMALEGETVYEAQDKGETVGIFTVKHGLRSSTEDRNWIGIGSWKSAAPKPQTDFSRINARQSAEVVRGITAPSMGDTDPADSDDRQLQRKKTTVYDENGKEIPAGGKDSKDAKDGKDTKDGKDSKDDKDGPKVRPTLRRPQQDPPENGGGTDSKGQEKPKPPSGDNDPDRPTIKRGGNSGTQTSPPQDKPTAQTTPKPDDKNTASKNDDDPDRPKIKRGIPVGGSTITTVNDKTKAARMQDADPNRPVLRRGKPASRVEEEQQSVARPVPDRILQRGSSAPILDMNRTKASGEMLLPKMRTYEVVAISDADGKEQETFRFKWTDDEKRELTAKMRSLAQKEADAFLKSIGRAPVGPSVAAVAPTKAARTIRGKTPTTGGVKSQFNDDESQVVPLDLNHNNSSILVFTGHQKLGDQPAAAQVFVTVVARVDLEGNPRKLFTNVTTSDRLDAKPWLEFIDAVDAEGKGHGELLFRRIRDTGSEFALYHVGVDDVVEMFHGGVGD
jgi:hypothetical protein